MKEIKTFVYRNRIADMKGTLRALGAQEQRHSIERGRSIAFATSPAPAIALAVAETPEPSKR